MDALQSGRITGNPEVIAGSVSGNVRSLSGLPRRKKDGLSQDLLPGQFR